MSIMYIYLDPPYWVTGLEGRQVGGVVGQSSNLSCNVDSNPPPTYKWKFKGQLLSGKSSKFLLVPIVSENDFGNYTCISTNTIRRQTYKVEFSITLVPRGGPDPPSALEVTHITSVSADIHWTAGFDGGYQDAWFEVDYKLGSEPDFGGWEKVDGVPAGQTVTHGISSLSEQSYYLVRIKAVNSHDGRSESSPMEVTFKTKSKLQYKITVSPNSYYRIIIQGLQHICI